MRSPIDKFGRVIIPKSIREHLGLFPGVSLEIEEIGDAIQLKVAVPEPEVKEEHGILVYTGKMAGDIEGALHKIREGRLDQLGDIDS